MQRHTPPQFFFSILTAIIVGVGTAYIGIMGIQIVKKPELAARALQFVASAAEFASSGISSIRFLSREIVYEAGELKEELGDRLMLSSEVLAAANGSSPDSVTAIAYSVQSLDRNNVLVDRDSERLLPIASVTKLITAALARQLFTDKDIIEITRSVLVTEGDSGRFKEGEKYKIDEILYPLLLVSSNDAAEAIAQAYDKKNGSGSFVKLMNQWTNSIGAYRTYFRDSSGLSPQNVSTARDLSIIAKWIHDNDPEIYKITLTKSKTVRTHTWNNPTHFLSFSSYVGGKNGFIPEAKLTSVSLFTAGTPQRLYSVVLLGSQQRDKDALTVLNTAVK